MDIEHGLTSITPLPSLASCTECGARAGSTKVERCSSCIVEYMRTHRSHVFGRFY